ncbi:hypothetical protein SAMN02910339_00921 [Lachnospiraceae bacterium YSD2013]|nr:hypothetical protein SAMN02910339_00921 [Lachnospiraceae bacterium YSD2013]
MTNRVLTTVGKVAKTPYYFEKVYVNIYSMEELCYVLYENAFLIDKDILDKKLVEWIDKECGLTDLARNLYMLVNTNALPGAFVGTILEYVGYYNADEIEKVESILRMNVSMNVFEKWKAKADFLYENHHYYLALKEYERVLSGIDDEETELKSRIFNNMGVTCMALCLYDSAVDYFKKAYEINNDETAFRHMLTVERLRLPESEYIKLIADSEDAYRMSIPIEGELEELKAEFDASDKAKHLKSLFELKDQKDAALYYEEILAMTGELKEEYRDIALENGDI